MIVELFGPPCAGKTTFARLLVSGLQARGLPARALISARASEADAPGGAARRPATGTADAQAWKRDACEAVNKAMLRLLPPRSPIWQVRLRRYLRVLAASWARCDKSADVVVFDQGYTQALCSLVSLTRRPEPACVQAAADLLPRPALRINLTVPRGVLVARLAQRSRCLTLRERILEVDNATIIEQDRICSVLFDMLDGDGAIMRAMSSGTTDMPPFLDAVARKLRPPAIEPGPRALREVVR